MEAKNKENKNIIGREFAYLRAQMKGILKRISISLTYLRNKDSRMSMEIHLNIFTVTCSKKYIIRCN